jgi:hypothetical protein
MLKTRSIYSVLFLLALLACVSACKNGNNASIPQSSAIKPNVSSVPAGWYPSSDDASLRSLEYRNNVSDDYVRIHYGEVPNTLVGNETNGNALMDQVESEAPFTTTNKSLTVVGGRLAGLAQAYNVTSDSY